MTATLCERLGDQSDRARAVKAARWILRMRRRRPLGLTSLGGMLGEPAWDIVLDLFVAGATGRVVTTDAVCAGASVSPSAATRWLNLLQRQGVLICEDDAQEGDRIVYLSPRADMEMERMLAAEFDIEVNEEA